MTWTWDDIQTNDNPLDAAQETKLTLASSSPRQSISSQSSYIGLIAEKWRGETPAIWSLIAAPSDAPGNLQRAMKNLTPDHKCSYGACPAVYELPPPDTRLLIIGSDVNAIAKWMNDKKIKVGANESAVLVEPELLANALKTK